MRKEYLLSAHLQVNLRVHQARKKGLHPLFLSIPNLKVGNQSQERIILPLSRSEILTVIIGNFVLLVTLIHPTSMQRSAQFFHPLLIIQILPKSGRTFLRDENKNQYKFVAALLDRRHQSCL